MKEFKIGDRVRLRGKDERGTVRRDPGAKIMVAVELDSTRGTYTYYHHELLIRLKPMEKPRRFVLYESRATGGRPSHYHVYAGHESCLMGKIQLPENCFEVVEVMNRPKSG